MMFMKNSSGIILASVLGACALFGFGVSQITAPLTEGVSSSMKAEKEVKSSAVSNLRADLEAGYDNIVIQDEDLEDLECASGFTSFKGIFDNSECYQGPTDTPVRYGMADVEIDGVTVTVQLASMPGGAYLLR